METIQPGENELILTQNPTITVQQMHHINFDKKMFEDTERPHHLYLITTPKLRYLRKFRVGTFTGTLSEFVAEFKAREMDINILRFERVYMGAKKYQQYLMDIYGAKELVQDGWINTNEFEIKTTFDKVMKPVKFENIEYALESVRNLCESRNDISDLALGMLVLAIRRVFDSENESSPKYSAIYDAKELSFEIAAYDSDSNNDLNKC